MGTDLGSIKKLALKKNTQNQQSPNAVKI